MKELTLKEIQKEELNILVNLTKYLDKNNLNYFLWAGTFLGAVRHKGFIPWDDDIDITMERPDYDKLIECIKRDGIKLSNNLEFTGFEINNGIMPFLKLCNNDFDTVNKNNYHSHLWVDIFPLDAISSNKEKQYKMIEKQRKYFLLRTSKDRMSGIQGRTKLRLFILKIVQIFINLLPKDKVINNYINKCKEIDYNSTDYVTNNMWRVGRQLVIPKSLLKTKLYEFDGYKFKGIKDYDKILTMHYGKYMELPPEDKRKTHNFTCYKVEKK